MYKLLFISILYFSFLFAESDLIVSPEVINLGQIPDIKEVDMTFEVRNQGQTSVVIEKIETSCGCSSATPSPQLIAPGKLSKIGVKLNPKGKKGENSWQIKIFTNSITNPIVYASFHAKILHTGVISHSFLSFGEFRQETSQKKEFWISPQKFPNFKILSVQQNLFTHKQECFNVAIKDDVYAGFYPGKRPAKRIELTTKKEIPFGRIDGELIIKTNIPQHEEMRLSVLARVAGDIGVRPDSVSFGLLKKSKSKTRHLYIYHRHGKPFTIAKIHSPWKELSVSVEEMLSKQYYKLTLKFASSAILKNGELREHLTVETSDKKQSIIKIPLQGYAVK